MIQEPLVSVNLATVSMEAFFYGIFFVLSTTSTYLLVIKQRKSVGPLRATPPPLYHNPMFIGAIALSTTITAVLSPFCEAQKLTTDCDLLQALDTDYYPVF